MSARRRPSLFVMIGVLMCWAAMAAPGNGTEGGCGGAMDVTRYCQESAAPRGEATRNEVTMLRSPSDWDAPMHEIYQSHLAPLFAACACPFYGVEETESWNDPDQPGLRWWQVTIVLGVQNNGTWELRSREYLFSAKDAEPPKFARLASESSWPVTPAVPN